MLIGIVVTRSEEWVKNVINGIMCGVREVDFWNSGRLPIDEKIKDLKYIEVYYKNKLILQGDYVKSYSDTPINVFNEYSGKKSLSSIGLIDNSNFSDFQKILNVAFTSSCPQKIGNIIFEVKEVSKYAIELYSNNNFNIVDDKKPPKHIQNISYYEV